MDQWQISCDVGGTFTDCVAVSPSGVRRTLKIPSASWLPAKVGSTVHGSGDGSDLSAVPSIPNTTVIELHTPLQLPADFFAGWELVSAGLKSSIIHSSPVGEGSTHILTLAQPGHPAPGSPVTLQSSEPSPVIAARIILGKIPGEPLGQIEMRLGTTRGTNALLEGTVSPTALFVTQGFRDVLEIGDQTRLDLFAWHPRRARSFASHVFEVEQRHDSQGRQLRELNEPGLREAAADALRRGLKVGAIAFVNAWTNPSHERRAEAILREMGFKDVSVSSTLAPVIGFEQRARTALVDGLLAAPVGDTLRAIAHGLGDEATLLVMTSAGGLEDHRSFHPKDSLLSGPAGGARGAMTAAVAAKMLPAIAFDMGGTSTDVCVLSADIEYRFETEVAGARLASPSIAVDSVGCGGGSICAFDGSHLRVGPQSAGGDPGPACYGRGGPLTLTDVNLLLGRLGTISVPLDVNASQRAASVLLQSFTTKRGALSMGEFLLSLVRVADENMAAAVRRSTIRRGLDPASFTLVAFGGAGGLHAVSVAQILGIARVLLPVDAGILSACGIAGTDRERFVHQTVNAPLLSLPPIRNAFAGLAAEVGADWRYSRYMLRCRLIGQDEPLTIDLSAIELDDLSRVAPQQEPTSHWRVLTAARFAAAYTAMYGYPPPDRPLEIESIRGVLRQSTPIPATPSCCIQPPLESETHQRAGPFNIITSSATAWVPSGWTARTLPCGSTLLECCRRCEVSAETTSAADTASTSPPVAEEVFACRIMGLAADMGEVLRRTAVSVNVKHRLDFSCAVLDASGSLVANAPHLPVHLGALGVCTRSVVATLGARSGDVFVTNHPGFGGSHLPDVTVITPVFANDGGGQLLGFVANRAHHAEIGGTRPGSMPPGARCLEEEGVVIAPMRIARDGMLDLSELDRLLRTVRFPSRSPLENIADLRAQVAANALGVEQLRRLYHSGVDLARGFAVMHQRSRERCEQVIDSMDTAPHEVIQSLDDGAEIRLRVEVLPTRPRRLRLDFSGSAPVQRSSFNAPASVIRSATMYTLRLLAGKLIPNEAQWMALNEGFLEPVELINPEGMLNPSFVGAPSSLPPVAAGNVETSQRVVDALVLALNISACSQGTMNNLLIGDATFAYYETICGGAGASESGAGESAIHSHMTNTRITDAEILEAHFPMLLEEFGIRPNSGGGGKYRGGCGAIRRIKFLRPLEISFISQHRSSGPAGLAGGKAGRVGQQWIIHAAGGRTPLDGVSSFDVEAGDAIEIHTPGGGGFGAMN